MGELQRIESKIDHVHAMLHAIAVHIANQDADQAAAEKLRATLAKMTNDLQNSLNAQK